MLNVILFLKNNNETKFKQLVDITAVDYPEMERRFKIVYLLLSHENNQRIQIEFSIKENYPVTSITSVFSLSDLGSTPASGDSSLESAGTSTGTSVSSTFSFTD